MKRSGCKTVIGLLFVQVIFLCSVSVYGADLDKKFNKEFNTQGKDLLEISNRYGDVEIISWDGNTVSIEVTVTLSHPNESKAEKLLSLIEVKFSENDNTIGAKTVIDKQFSFNNWGDERKFSIDYVVKMPADFNLDLINRYGAVKAGELSGQVDIIVKYGSLFIQELTRGKEKPLNSITLSYSKGKIVSAGWAELNLRYVGKMNIESATALLVDSRYSKLEVDEVSSVVVDSKYDSFILNNLKNIVAESGYTSYVIGNLLKNLDIEANYGSIVVTNVDKGFDSIEAEASYCGVKIGMDDAAKYQLNAKTQYGGLYFNEENADITQRIYENNSKYVEAVVGGGEPTSVISIRTKYGSIKIR